MTTNELEGRALAEAAARAMGWKKLQGSETWDDGTYLRTMDQRPITERECLAWLLTKSDSFYPQVHLEVFEDGVEHNRAMLRARCGLDVEAFGDTYIEALQRLVVAVAAREALAKRCEGTKWVEDAGEREQAAKGEP
jgi:hypothetical protein